MQTSNMCGQILITLVTANFLVFTIYNFVKNIFFKDFSIRSTKLQVLARQNPTRLHCKCVVIVNFPLRGYCLGPLQNFWLLPRRYLRNGIVIKFSAFRVLMHRPPVGVVRRDWRLVAGCLVAAARGCPWPVWERAS